MYQLVLELIEIIQVTFQHSSVSVSTYDGFHFNCAGFCEETCCSHLRDGGRNSLTSQTDSLLCHKLCYLLLLPPLSQPRLFLP